MHYLVGDIQGCASALDRLLDEIAFSPSRDHVYVLGDLVNRGPGSLATLRRLRGLGAAASCVLGNHDWHLLAVAAGVRPRHRSDTLDDILDAPDREEWLAWVRTRRMAVFEQGWLMLHAGVVPQWDLATTLQLAGELEQSLRERPPREFLAAMFGNEPARWSDSLARRRAPALHAQHPDPDPLRRRRRHARVPDQGRRRRRSSRVSAPGSTCPAGARQACRSPSVTGRRSASSSATTCWGWTPAASGAIGSPRSGSTPTAGRSSTSHAPRRGTRPSAEQAPPEPEHADIAARRWRRARSCEDRAPAAIATPQPGDVAEWSKAAVLKTAEGATPP